MEWRRNREVWVVDVVDRQVQVVVPKGEPPKMPGQKEDERRLEATRVRRAKSTRCGMRCWVIGPYSAAVVAGMARSGTCCGKVGGATTLLGLPLVCARAVSPRMGSTTVTVVAAGA